MDRKVYDVICIGGGPAGLGLATTVARQDFSVLILDSGVYRNARSNHLHVVAGFDHAAPTAFLAKMRADLRERYEKTEFKSAVVKTVRKLDNSIFEAVDEQNEAYQGKRLVLATGVKDIMEDIPGYEHAWGRGIFHCLFCHGYEERGSRSVGVLATGLTVDPDVIERVAKMAKRLSKHVTVYTNGNADLASLTKAQLHSTKIDFDNRMVAEISLVEDGPEVELIFSDGSRKREGFLANLPKYEQRSSLAAQLGLEMEETGEIKVEAPFNKTSLPGCMAAGDAATPYHGILQALHMAAGSGGGIVVYLQDELEAEDEL